MKLSGSNAWTTTQNVVQKLMMRALNVAFANWSMSMSKIPISVLRDALDMQAVTQLNTATLNLKKIFVAQGLDWEQTVNTMRANAMKTWTVRRREAINDAHVKMIITRKAHNTAS
jgi:hypothetical protein